MKPLSPQNHIPRTETKSTCVQKNSPFQLLISTTGLFKDTATFSLQGRCHTMDTTPSLNKNHHDSALKFLNQALKNIREHPSVALTQL